MNKYFFILALLFALSIIPSLVVANDEDTASLSREYRSRYYTKLELGAGNKGEKLPLKIPGNDSTLDPSSFNVVDWSVALGYEFSNHIGAEISYGHSEYSFTGCDFCLGGDSADFSNNPFTFTLVYRFLETPGFNEGEYYVGAGVGYYMNPKLNRSYGSVWNMTNTTVEYENDIGYNIGIGARFGKTLFYSFDIKYVFGVMYKFARMEENGTNYNATYPEWQEIEGNGMVISLGIGYKF